MQASCKMFFEYALTCCLSASCLCLSVPDRHLLLCIRVPLGCCPLSLADIARITASESVETILPCNTTRTCEFP